MKQEIHITALPAGIIPGRNGGEPQLKLSAFISIKVKNTGDTTLAALPDLMDWTTTIRKAKWLLMRNDATPVEVSPVTDAIDEALWKKLFTPTIKVKAFAQEDLSQKPMFTFNVQHVLAYLHQSFESVGKAHVDKLPPVETFTGNRFFTDIADIGLLKVDPAQVARQAGSAEALKLTQFYEKRNYSKERFTTQTAKETIPAYSRMMSPALTFQHFRTFHDPAALRQRASIPPMPNPDFEFHDILSVLTLYPQLLRKLGLVIDVLMPLSKTPFVLANETGTVRLVPSGINFTTATDISAPPTAYEKTPNGYYTQEKAGSDIDKGHLKVDTEDFTILQVDTDGAAMKMAAMMDTLQLKLAQQSFELAKFTFRPLPLLAVTSTRKPVVAGNMVINGAVQTPLYSDLDNVKREEAMPGMRSAGIAIAKNNMAGFLLLKSATMLNFAGLMFQKVLAVPPVFKSNNANYFLPSGTLYTDDLVQGYRMDIAYSNQPSVWYSLHRKQDSYTYKPVSGAVQVINGIEADEGYVQLAISEDATGKKVNHVSEVIARWEGWSLSAPRPGHLLDDNSSAITGEGITAERQKFLLPAYIDFRLEVQTVAVKGSLPLLRYGREYNIKVRTVDLAGNSTDLQTTPENAKKAVIHNYKYLRYEPVAPPLLLPATPNKDGESAERMVIRSNAGVSPDQYEAAVAGKNTGNATYAGQAIRHVKPPRTSVQMAEWHGMLDAAFGKDRGAAAAQIYARLTAKDPKTDPASASSAQTIMPAEELPIEYLADPMAAGVSLFLSENDQNGKKILGDGIKQFSFFFDQVNTPAEANQPVSMENWLKAKAFRIQLMEGNGNFDWNSAKRLLTIGLPKGTILRLNYSCFWRSDDLLNSAGMMQTLKLTSLAGFIGEKIATGRHWMFSPWRELTLVHAVQQPLTDPVLQEIAPERDYGETTALLHTLFTTHSASTEKIDIECNWVETVDDLLNPAPLENMPFSQHVTTVPVHYSFPVLRMGERLQNTGVVAGLYNAKHPLLHQLNDTRHRNVQYKIVATTRYRENFVGLLTQVKPAPPITRESIYAKTVNLLSTARPLAPEIAYVLPSFEWERAFQGKKLVTGRLSNIRVYLKRPWYSSGDGELLGVVIPASASGRGGVVQLMANNNPSNPNLLTQWGTDPTKISSGLMANGGVQTNPEQENFVNPFKVENNLSIREESNRRVKVIGYPVQFDIEKQLYFADILLNINEAYFPFVKLALARYQPDSLHEEGTDCCLSPIVNADFIQIPAPRSTSLEHGLTKNVFTVAILGTAPSIVTPVFATEVEIIVEDASQVIKSGDAFIKVQGEGRAARPLYAFRQRIERKHFIKGNTFYFAHPVTIGLEFALKPFRIRVMEYEMLPGDPLRSDGVAINIRGVAADSTLQERLVFSDVYEVGG